MKPIFEDEKIFLEENLGVKLPNNCWRDGKKIYLNSDKESFVIQFRVEHKKIIITKNKLEEVVSKIKNKTFEEEVIENKTRLDNLEKESIEKTIEFINRYPNNEIRISHSGGKDSDVMWHILQKVFEEMEIDNYVIDFFNTTNDTAQTYLHVKMDLPREHLQINNPKKGWYEWLKRDKNYYLPSVMVRNCCSTYKEGQVKKILDKNKNYIIFLGARKYESAKRSKYDWDLNEAWLKANPNKKLNMPSNWQRFLPIVNFTDVDIWLYILRENIKINPMYKLGFNRTGCLLCPYSSDYTDLLIEKHYPLHWDRWCSIVETNYDLYDVKTRLKWSKEEYIQEGKWKQATSKEQDLITKKATPERIKELAKLKGVSEEVAAKYFKKECSCGKKLNPDEIAMFLKLMGRYEGVEDNRVYLCKNCLCELLGITKEEYAEKVREFRSQGCNLF